MKSAVCFVQLVKEMQISTWLLQQRCLCCKQHVFIPACGFLLPPQTGILSVSVGLLDCNYSTRPCFFPSHQRYYTLLVCGFPTETLATYRLKVAHFDEVHVPPKLAGLKVLHYSQPGICTASLSLSKVHISPKWKNLLLQENDFWPDKVIIYSIPHATCTRQEDDFHACRRRMVLWFKPREQDSSNQGSMTPDEVPPRRSDSASAARRCGIW